jgi:hypothetical protein
MQQHCFKLALIHLSLLCITTQDLCVPGDPLGDFTWPEAFVFASLNQGNAFSNLHKILAQA